MLILRKEITNDIKFRSWVRTFKEFEFAFNRSVLLHLYLLIMGISFINLK